MAYISPVLNVMMAAARKAGKPLIRDFGELENLQVSMKGPADFVTSADKRTEQILIDELTRAFALVTAFLAEESGAIEGADKTHRFIIDPLDGTTNFLHGIPHFAISGSRWSAKSQIVYRSRLQSRDRRHVRLAERRRGRLPQQQAPACWRAQDAEHRARRHRDSRSRATAMSRASTRS